MREKTNVLYGLVLAGGQSSRMGRDKGLLEYHGQPHRFHLHQLLSHHCEQVFLSINARQEPLESQRYNYLIDNDAYADTGPFGAVLNAHERHPTVAWFIVSCDLPFFDESCADTLITHRDVTCAATAFLNSEMNQPEPLVTIYENAFLLELPGAYQYGERSLRKLLNRVKVKLIESYDARCVQSVDRPEEYEAAKGQLKAGPHAVDNSDASSF